MSYFVYKSYEVVTLRFQSELFGSSLKHYLPMPMYIVTCTDSHMYN